MKSKKVVTFKSWGKGWFRRYGVEYWNNLWCPVSLSRISPTVFCVLFDKDHFW